MKFRRTPDFDVLAEDPQNTAEIVKERLRREGIKNVHIRKKNGIGELIAEHYELIVNGETILMIYEPIACHSYNLVRMRGRSMKIATIDTMLSFYLAFMYVNRPYYDPNRIICMAEYLFKVQQFNRLSQRGILKRFSINCYGKQDTINSILKEKSEMYDKLKRGTRKWDYYFLKYDPVRKAKKRTKYKKTKKRKRRKKNKTRRKFFSF